MSAAPASPSTSLRTRAGSSWRWVAVVSLSLLIHVVALDALPRWTLEPAGQRAHDQPLRAFLLPAPPPPASAVASPPVPAHATAAKARPARPRFHAAPALRVAPIPEFVPESVDDAVADVEVSVDGEPSWSGRARTAPGAGGSAAPESSAAAGSAKAMPPPPPDALAPVSARLDYKVVAVERKHADPVHYYGVGSIDWASNGGRYRADLKAAVDFLLFKVNVLASHSEGAITATGLAPDRYTEAPRKRSTVATNFNRDARQSISYSASAATVPLPAGAQDRLSVLFQIGALLRATPGLAAAGGQIAIPVAGVRGEVETWIFLTEGVETIDVGPGPLATAHLRRVPEPGTHDKIIDIWIAYADGGYPARVLYTESNGSTIEMTLEKIGAAD